VPAGHVKVPGLSLPSTNKTAKKYCASASDRKVRCDEYFPVCINCSRAKRRCDRSTFRLSWPQTSNSRRFSTHRHRPKDGARCSYRSSGRLTFLNASTWDLTLQKELISSGASRRAFLSVHWHVRRLMIPSRTLQVVVIRGAQTDFDASQSQP
jgi:hypothetical protein